MTIAEMIRALNRQGFAVTLTLLEDAGTTTARQPPVCSKQASSPTMNLPAIHVQLLRYLATTKNGEAPLTDVIAALHVSKQDWVKQMRAAGRRQQKGLYFTSYWLYKNEGRSRMTAYALTDDGRNWLENNADA